MAGVPAHCPHCGHTFITNAVSGSGNARIIINSVSTDCPRCGKPADILDATYDFDFVGHAVNVTGASDKTIAILTTLQTALLAAKSGKSENEILAELAKASPELAGKAKDAVRLGGMKLLISLLFVLLYGCSQNIHESLDWNVLVDQAHTYITGSDPYPIARSHTEDQEADGKQPKMSRQQRRQQERQSRKQLKRGQQQPSRKDG